MQKKLKFRQRLLGRNMCFRTVYGLNAKLFVMFAFLLPILVIKFDVYPSQLTSKCGFGNADSWE